MRGKLLFREYDKNGKIIKLQCWKCGEVKNIDCFNKDKARKDGYSILYECIRRV